MKLGRFARPSPPMSDHLDEAGPRAVAACEKLAVDDRQQDQAGEEDAPEAERPGRHLRRHPFRRDIDAGREQPAEHRAAIGDRVRPVRALPLAVACAIAVDWIAMPPPACRRRPRLAARAAL